MKKGKTVLIFGANGFIGHHLVRQILDETDWSIIASDVASDRLVQYRKEKRFEFYKGNIRDLKLCERLVKRADVVVPLAGIATPKTYIEDPLKVFEIDFEANLAIVRMC